MLPHVLVSLYLAAWFYAIVLSGIIAAVHFIPARWCKPGLAKWLYDHYPNTSRVGAFTIRSLLMLVLMAGAALIKTDIPFGEVYWILPVDTAFMLVGISGVGQRRRQELWFAMNPKLLTISRNVFTATKHRMRR